MTDPSICAMSVFDLSERIRSRELSPIEIAEACLERIEALNRDYLGFVMPTPERAINDARKAEEEIASGNWRGPLHGIPYGAKDIINTAGIRTTNGSRLFEDNVPATDATCITRLTQAGAVLLGKTNTHQWAAASTTINTHYGTSRNPWNRERIVGGSSGGSAAAVASGMCPLALGTDTGGSIRTPAALCGLVGLKPTHGRIPLTGIFPNTPSYDHPGPMTRTVRDAALALQILAGYEPTDAKSKDRPVPDYMAAIDDGVQDLRIVLCPDFYGNADVDSEIADAFGRVVDTYRDLGARIETVSFPDATRFDDLFRRVAGPEFTEVHRALYDKSPEEFEDDVRERLEWSVTITTDEYVRALRELELLCREVDRFFTGVDAMITPAVPCVAPPIETLKALVNGQEVDYRRHIHRPFLTSHDVTGCPALVMPMGLNSQGLPMSFQVVGGRWRESEVLRTARGYEAAASGLGTTLPPG